MKNSGGMRVPRRIWVASIGVGLAAAIGWWWFTRPTRADLEQTVVEAIARNDLPKAEAALLQIRPRDADVLQLLADVAFRSGRQRDCVHRLEQLAEASGRPSTGFVAAGARAFEFGFPADAERLYRRAIAAAPAALEPYSRLARLYLAWQRGDELRRLLADADAANVPLTDDPALLWLWIVGDRVDWLEDDSRRWLELVRKEQPEDGFVAAALVRMLLESKQSSQAREIVDLFPVGGSTSWPVVLARATVELASDRPTEALAAIRQLPEEGERHAETWFVRGRIWLACGDAEGALLAFEQAGRLDPWFVNALYNHGRLFARTGRTTESEAELRHAATTDDLVRRCLQLLQSTQPDGGDLRSVAVLAAELGHSRWTQLVCQLAEDRAGPMVWPETVLAARADPVARLSVARALPAPSGLAARRVVSAAQDSSTTAGREPADTNQIRFTEATRELGLQFVYKYGHAPQRWLMETLGGGVAVLDYDLDGWPDVFFAQGGSLPVRDDADVWQGRLWHNVRATSFQDVTGVANAAVSGYAHGCAVADINNDGFADLLVCRYGGLTLLTNQGDGTWIDSTDSAGIANDRWNTSAAFADLDRDGDWICTSPGIATRRSPTSCDPAVRGLDLSRADRTRIRRSPTRCSRMWATVALRIGRKRRASLAREAMDWASSLPTSMTMERLRCLSATTRVRISCGIESRCWRRKPCHRLKTGA